MKNVLGLVLISTFSFSIYAQIPIEAYKTEISSLKTELEIKDYWAELFTLDQDILLNLPTTNLTVFDSLSTSNMIRTALMFEIHGSKSYKKNNNVPLLNFTHHYIGEANLIFWPIIEKCADIGGTIMSFGGGFPAYQLEGIANNFYGYSLQGQNSIYDGLLENLKNIQKDSIASRLNNSYLKQRQYRTLKVKESLGEWYQQQFKKMKEERSFEFVKMSDDSVYYVMGEYLQKLLLIAYTNDNKVYRIEGEPFGWYYKLSKSGELSLLNSADEILIGYTKF